MHLENVVVDAADPARLGRFWATALDLDPVHEADGVYEARLTVDDGPWLDLCFPRVSGRPAPGPRLHLDLLGGDGQDAVVQRLLGLGARHLDIGQHDVPWVVMADPEGNAFCVMEEREAYRGTGPIAALPLDSADPERDAVFWAAITGWVQADGHGAVTLRHASGRGPLLELCPEPRAKRAENRLHLDVRPDGDEDTGEQVERALDLGARRVEHAWGDLPWTVLADPSGNEVCVLPGRRPAPSGRRGRVR